MGRGIPKVRAWLVRKIDGEGEEVSRHEILAPTRLLAIMNARHAGIYGPLVVSPKRSKVEACCGSKDAEDGTCSCYSKQD